MITFDTWYDVPENFIGQCFIKCYETSFLIKKNKKIVSLNGKIKIYPNPIDTGHVLYIEDLDNSKLPISISFIDEKGIAVYDKIMNFPYILNLNIMNLHSGIYALILKKDGKEISYQKILIK
mgnify:CR=1 FL=1